MPEHAPLDTVLAEAVYALNRALREFSMDSADHTVLTVCRDYVWDIRKSHNPDLTGWP